MDYILKPRIYNINVLKICVVFFLFFYVRDRQAVCIFFFVASIALNPIYREKEGDVDSMHAVVPL